MTNPIHLIHTLTVPSASITPACTGALAKANALGLRAIQEGSPFKGNVAAKGRESETRRRQPDARPRAPHGNGTESRPARSKCCAACPRIRSLRSTAR